MRTSSVSDNFDAVSRSARLRVAGAGDCAHARVRLASERLVLTAYKANRVIM